MIPAADIAAQRRRQKQTVAFFKICNDFPLLKVINVWDDSPKTKHAVQIVQ